mgnify:CR=1 FL=1
MKKVVRKNQIIITALALLIAVAGYVSYTQTAASDQAVETAADEVADTYEISDEDTVAEIFTDTEDNGQTAQAEEGQSDPADGASGENGEAAGGEEASAPEGENAGETVLTSAGAVTDFAAEVKLNREQVRSKNKETLLDIINNSSISEAQKQDAVDEMVAMTDVAERENAAELLLEAKGFTDVVVSITDESADVVLDMGDVTDAKRAQVEDIVKRKTGIAAEHIVITPITQ